MGSGDGVGGVEGCCVLGMAGGFDCQCVVLLLLLLLFGIMIAVICSRRTRALVVVGVG